MFSLVRIAAHAARCGSGQRAGALVVLGALFASGQSALAGGIGDFDGDGRADVLLRHADGRWRYYPMDGRRQVAEGRGSANLTRDLEWSVSGIGDFDGDGRADVLLRHADGRWRYYRMNGRRHVAGDSGIATLTRNTAWSLAGTGDFDGDGRDDVLLRHADGRWYYYAMNGRRHVAGDSGIAALTRNTAWSPAGTGDFDGDGRDDVLLRHADGRWYHYAMNGRRPVAGGRGMATLTRNPTWSLAGTGDFGADGRDDVLLRHADGRWFHYAMHGRRHIAGQAGNAELTRDLSWRLGGGGILQPGETFRDALSGGGEGPEMVVIPAGSFRMGCLSGDGDCDDSEQPVHAVTIGYRFALSTHEVTFAQWDACVADGGCGGYRPSDNGWGRGERPVLHVSWDDAQSYVSWLSEKTGEEYRLPSESEWEYAARAGTETKYHWGDAIGSNRANCVVTLCGDAFTYTSPAGSFPANAWGLHDMHGNAWEWVEDCLNGGYGGAPTDGSAWLSGDCSSRMLRGGSWSFNPWFLRAAHRGWGGTVVRNPFIGFRVSRRMSQTPGP